MSKFITVASQYSIYEVQDESFEVLGTGMKLTPPQIVLEVMVMNGLAKRIGTVGTLTTDMEESEFTGDDEDPPEGSGPWVGED